LSVVVSVGGGGRARAGRGGGGRPQYEPQNRSRPCGKVHARIELLLFGML
jgi:hypothetical protein